MRTWHVAILIGLSLAIGTAFGFAKWGLSVSFLSDELGTLQTEVDRLKRERDACHAGAGTSEQQWEGFGVVRAVYPMLLLITHDEIPGMLPAGTTGFRFDPTGHDPIGVGDAIHFTLHGITSQTAVIVGWEKW
ncbi:MAG: hypothetical protein V4554_11550 [Pseudomonadota bacterium]